MKMTNMSKPSPTTEEIWNALVESVKLQGHYAAALNQHDLGERLVFTDVHDWIQRLREVKVCSHNRVVRGEDAPRVYGSWRTQVCIDCGAFRTHGHHFTPDQSRPSTPYVSEWRPASAYQEAVAKREEDE